MIFGPLRSVKVARSGRTSPRFSSTRPTSLSLRERPSSTLLSSGILFSATSRRRGTASREHDLCSPCFSVARLGLLSVRCTSRSLIVDDVERYRGTSTSQLSSSPCLAPSWLAHPLALVAARLLPLCALCFTSTLLSSCRKLKLLRGGRCALGGIDQLRLPLLASQYQRSGDSGDYTKAASWYPNGTWVDPLPGPA